MRGGWKNGLRGGFGLDALTGWLLGMAGVILLAIAVSDASGAMAGGAGGLAARLLWISSDVALAAAVVAAAAAVPVLAHNFFGAGYSGSSLGRRSSRWAPAGLAVAGTMIGVSAGCLLAGSVLLA